MSSTKEIEIAKSCAECGTVGPDLNHCMACKSVFYCGTACQHSNSKSHEKECKARAFELDVELAKSKRPECPVCAYTLPLVGNDRTTMSCCGNTTCNACMIEHCVANFNFSCPFCRTPLPRNAKEADEHVVANFGKGGHQALVQMSAIYTRGNVGCGIEKDPKKGVELLKRAVDLGSANACSVLGKMYMRQKKYEKAEQILGQSANAGSASGTYQLGELHEKRRNKAASMYYSRLSAAMGFDRAMAKLTNIYTKTDPQHKLLKKEDFEASLRSFQVAKDEMKSEARERWGKYSLGCLTLAGYSWITLKLYKEGVISSLPPAKK